jgi:acyl-CoA thioester hydrolase
MTRGFRYARRAQFAETDLAGVVHFSCYFRYMEEAEHALWRAAGMAIAQAGAAIDWPRVSATFDYKHPLHFEEEFEVVVRLGAVTRSTIRYEFSVVRGDITIGAGTVTTVCARRTDGRMKAVKLPEDVVPRLRDAGA